MTRTGLADRGQDRLGDVEVVGREAREARDLLRAATRARESSGSRAIAAVDDRLRVAQAEDVDLADERAA